MPLFHLGFEKRSKYILACEQALRGTLAAGWEKEGELAATSLEFEYLHCKSQCEMLIGGDDISNDIITLGACFFMFFNIRTHFCFALIGGISVDGEATGELEVEFIFQRHSCKLSFLFLSHCQCALESLLAG